MSDFPECESLTGRVKQICRCETELPINGPHSVNAYRASKGIAPVDDDKSKPLNFASKLDSPSLLQQAKSFATSMGKAAANVIKTGKALVPQEITEERLAICKACPFYTGAKCKKCGCSCNGGASIANKLALAHEQCPIGKWKPFVAINPDNRIPGPDDPETPIPAEFTGPVVRHMVYHIWPTKRSEMWRWNVAELLKRIDQFDGKRIIGVATGNDTVPIEEVKKAFAGVRIDHWVTSPNDKTLGEGATFFKMVAMLPGGQNDVTWYGHAKGAKYEPADTRVPAIRIWCDLMYRSTLDEWNRVLKGLSEFPMAGPFKRYGDYNKPNTWRWHYSGTFFWFRNKETLSRNWERHIKFYGTIECWPSCIFKASEAYCLLGDDAGLLYSEEETRKHESAYFESLPSVCISVTCKGRLSHLKQALPTMLSQDYKGKMEIVIVDYGCPDGTAEWCETQPVKCVKVTEDTEYFCVSRAKNIGAMATNSDIILLCDAHNIVKPYFVSTMVRHMQSGYDIVWPEHKPGSSGCRRETFRSLRGLDESLKLYGWDDTDYLGRARAAGYRLLEAPTDLLDTIHHTPEDQVRFYPNKDVQQSIEINRKLCEDLTRVVNIDGYGRIARAASQSLSLVV